MECTWLQGKVHLRLHRRILFDGKVLPVDIRHSHRFCSGLSCDGSLRYRRRNSWVLYSLMRVRDDARRLACLGGRRMDGRMFGATRNCVTNAFLPEVEWANLSVPVFSTPNCSLARCAQYSIVVVPATPNDGPFPQPWVPNFLLLMSTISSGACCAQYSTVFVPAIPNNGVFTQPWVLHFLLLTLTIPFGACCAQYSLFLPATPNDASLPQFSVLHIMLQTSTIPYGACCAQYSAVVVPGTPNNSPFPQMMRDLEFR